MPARCVAAGPVACNCKTPLGRAHLTWCDAVKPTINGMVLQAQPSRWSCLPTSFAMVLGCLAQEIIDEVGHHDENGFHPQELTWVALKRGVAFVSFDAEPTFEPTMCRNPGCFKGCSVCNGTGYELHLDVFRVPTMRLLLDRYDGVLIGWADQKEHAVAWNHVEQKVYDPNFTTYGIEKFKIESFHARG